MKRLLSILSCVLFIAMVLIIGCGEDRGLPIAPNQQNSMAPPKDPKGNAYGRDRILAINTASGKIVCVTKVAVDKSPVLEAVDGVIQMGDSVIYVSLSPLVTDSFFDIFFDVSDSFFDVFADLYVTITLEEGTYQHDGCIVPSVVIIIVSGDVDPPTATKKIVGLLDTMDDVDAYSS